MINVKTQRDWIYMQNTVIKIWKDMGCPEFTNDFKIDYKTIILPIRKLTGYRILDIKSIINDISQQKTK